MSMLYIWGNDFLLMVADWQVNFGYFAHFLLESNRSGANETEIISVQCSYRDITVRPSLITERPTTYIMCESDFFHIN